MQRIVRVLAVALAAGAAAVAAGALPASARDDSLTGTRIRLFDPGTLTLPASEPAHVWHGHVKELREWAALGPDERREFMDDAFWRFELYVNRVAVPLERSFHVEHFPGGFDAMTKLHIAQFEADHFPPGTYVFEGRFYGDSDDDDVGELEVVVTRTVVFTAA